MILGELCSAACTASSLNVFHFLCPHLLCVCICFATATTVYTHADACICTHVIYMPACCTGSMQVDACVLCMRVM